MKYWLVPIGKLISYWRNPIILLQQKVFDFTFFPKKIEKLLVMTKSLDEPPTSKYRFYRDLYTQIFIYGENIKFD
jgi:hypothetical protein